MTHRFSSRTTTTAIELVVFVVWVGLSFAGMLHHPLWKDEAHHWLLARDSGSIADLFHNARYDGHPMVWELLVYAVSACSRNAVAMQITNLCVGAIATFLLLRYAPFPLLQKILIVFGYLFFFEYNIIIRNYMAAWLLLIVVCMLFTRPKRNYLLVTIILVVLANVHLFALVCTVPLFLLLMRERLQDKASGAGVRVLSCVYFLGIIVSALQIIPPADSFFITRFNALPAFSGIRVSRFCSQFVKGFFVVPDFSTYHFWNSNFIAERFKSIGYLLVVAGFLLPACCFKKQISLTIFYSSTIGISVLLYALPFQTMAHYLGYVVMMFLVALWFDKRYASDIFTFPILRRRASVIAGTLFLWVMLCVQTFSGVVAFWIAYTVPFSAGRETARYLLSEHGAPPGEIMVIPFQTGPPIASYMEQKIYYPESKRSGTFIDWNTVMLFENADITNSINEALRSSNQQYISLVVAYPPDKITALEHSAGGIFSNPRYAVTKVAVFDSSIINEERYHVYSLAKRDQQ